MSRNAFYAESEKYNDRESRLEEIRAMTKDSPPPAPLGEWWRNLFTCPTCGGHAWGTTNHFEKDRNKWVGRCNGFVGNRKDGFRRCSFEWPRTDDHLYGMERFSDVVPCTYPTCGCNAYYTCEANVANANRKAAVSEIRASVGETPDAWESKPLDVRLELMTDARNSLFEELQTEQARVRTLERELAGLREQNASIYERLSQETNIRTQAQDRAEAAERFKAAAAPDVAQSAIGRLPTERHEGCAIRCGAKGDVCDGACRRLAAEEAITSAIAPSLPPDDPRHNWVRSLSDVRAAAQVAQEPTTLPKFAERDIERCPKCGYGQLATVPEATPTPEWISVKDRLPEVGGKYLVGGWRKDLDAFDFGFAALFRLEDGPMWDRHRANPDVALFDVEYWAAIPNAPDRSECMNNSLQPKEKS